jgi:acyl-CoA synthetase (AMP-forming)/AMP-acid ligase II
VPPPLPRHVTDAATWSAMLGWWRGRSEPAVLAPDVTWSGDELLRRSAGAGDHLASLGVPPGRPIPALLTSSPTAFAYVVGGAGRRHPVAPLGPRLTAPELAACLAGLGTDVLLTEPEWCAVAREAVARVGGRVVLAEEPKPADSPLDVAPDPSEVAFVLHTSGTSGTPRAVPYSQGRMAARVRVNAGLCALRPGDRYATASPFHHIAGFGNYAVALAAGTALVPVPRFTVEAWRSVAALGATHALTVPTVLEMLLGAGVLSFDTLRVLQYGASPIHPDTLRRTLAAIPHVRLVNIYGQTEGSPITCLTAGDHDRIARDGADHLLSSVGTAAPGVDLRIDDADATGVGEVVARAQHLFLPDDDGWLRTGDLGRLDAEGYLFLVARKGDMIIRGGENVYPAEVEQVLEQHPSVREAAVVGVPDVHWGEVVRAYVVPGAGASPDVEQLRAHVRSHVAGFKVPTEWRVIDELPHNASGKLLRRSLANNQLYR